MKLVLGLLVTLGVLVSSWSFSRYYHFSSKRSPSPNHDQNQMRLMYREWRRMYGKLNSSPNEDRYRFEVFSSNVEKIEEINNSQSSYTLEANKFADITQEEARARYFGLGSVEPPKKEETNLAATGLSFSAEEAKRVLNTPVTAGWKDWSELDGMYETIHQQGCGSCYALATVTALEHLYFQKHRLKVKLSPQELIDCSFDNGNGGCVGGWVHLSLDYAYLNGMNTESAYPYIADESGECERKDHSRVSNLLNGYIMLTSNVPEKIKRALELTVVPSAINAMEILYYKSGVFNKDECDSKLNHAVVIVGYGEENGVKYWKIRNTWGSNWGEKGYFRIFRNEKEGTGTCGIHSYNVLPF